MKNFYLGTVLANPFIASVSSNSEQEVMPNSVAEPERSDHPEHNAQPSSYEAGAPIQSDELDCIADDLDCIAEIFAGHAKSDRRFTLNAAKFELALIDPPPLRNVA